MPMINPYMFSAREWREAHYAGAPWPEDNPKPIRLSKTRIREAIAACARKIDTIASGGLGGEFERGEDSEWIADLAGAIKVLAGYL